MTGKESCLALTGDDEYPARPMSKSEQNERLGEAKEMAPAWAAFAKGNTHDARAEAAKVVANASASAAAKAEATDLLERTAIDRIHLYAALLVGSAWLVMAALVYFR
jgi:hypothetical protein